MSPWEAIVSKAACEHETPEDLSEKHRRIFRETKSTMDSLVKVSNEEI